MLSHVKCAFCPHSLLSLITWLKERTTVKLPFKLFLLYVCVSVFETGSFCIALADLEFPTFSSARIIGMSHSTWARSYVHA